MHQYGHYGVALLCYAPVGTVVALAGFEALAVLGGAACVGLSMLPDVDIRLPFVPHRGPTHTLVFALLVGVVLAAIAGVLSGVGTAAFVSGVGLVAFAFLVGALSVCSHLLADVITPMGIRPFVPVSDRRYTFDLVRAANPIANYLLLGIGAASVGLAAGLVNVVS